MVLPIPVMTLEMEVHCCITRISTTKEYNLDGGQDASDMEYLHVDLWTLSTSAIKVSPINSGTGPGDALQTISHTIGSWTSVDIPIEIFTGS